MTFYSDLNQQDSLIDNKIYDLEAIYQSIHNIIHTQKGTRLFLPEFGMDLEQYLFELMDHATVNMIFLEVYNALNRWEPRIQIHNELSRAIPDNEHTVNIEIVFSIKGKLGEKYIYQTSLTNNQKEAYYEL